MHMLLWSIIWYIDSVPILMFVFLKTKLTKVFFYPLPLFFQQFRLTGAINKSDDRRELPTIPQPTHTVSSSQSYNEIDYVAQTKYYNIDRNWSWILWYELKESMVCSIIYIFFFCLTDTFCFSYRSNGWPVPISNTVLSAVTFLSPGSSKSPRDTYSPTWIRPSLSTKGEQLIGPRHFMSRLLYLAQDIWINLLGSESDDCSHGLLELEVLSGYHAIKLQLLFILTRNKQV